MKNTLVWPLLISAVVIGLASSTAAGAGCSVTQNDFDGNGSPDVRILGDGRPQVIVITDSQTSYRVQIDCNRDGDLTDPGDIDTGTVAAEVETFDVQGGGRDDIRYYAASPFSGAMKNVLVTFGPSIVTVPNRLTVVLQAPWTASSSLVVDVAGSSGLDDVVFSVASDITDSSIVLRGDLGAGVLEGLEIQAYGGTLRNSVLTADVGGQGSKFARVGPALETLDNSTFAVNVEGSATPTGTNWFYWPSFELTLDNGSRYLSNLRMPGGTNLFVGQLGANTFRILNGSEIHLRVRGGAGKDVMTLSDIPGYTYTYVNDGLLDLALTGGAGDDTITVDLSGQIQGSGTTRMRVDAGDGNDVVFAGLTADSSASTPDFDFAVYGGRGSDGLFAALVDIGGAATYDPAGPVLVYGGDGTDSCVLFGNGASQRLSCENYH